MIMRTFMLQLAWSDELDAFESFRDLHIFCILEAFMPSSKRFFDRIWCHIDFAHTGSGALLNTGM
jgi:hypothetical protein